MSLLVACALAACAGGTDPSEPPPENFGGAGGASGGAAGGTGGAAPVPDENRFRRPQLGPLLTADCQALGLSAPADVEGGDCCGCLCAGALWSCSEDTCLDADGQVEELAPEAGYIEIPGGGYSGGGEMRVGPTHRVFYSFQPANDEPEERPLAVFFNGGPGSATTPYLMALNTGPLTLDPERTGAAEIAENEHSFTRAYNLLYIDAPATGFSYALPLENGETPELAMDMDRDAGLVNRVLLFFLRHHEGLKDNKVILIGESYGGTRAAQMVRQLLIPESLLDEDSPYADPALYCELQAHFEARDDVEVQDIAAQFGHLALIQPWLLGLRQNQSSVFDTSACAPEPDLHQCDEPVGFDETLTTTLVQRLLAPDNLELLLGTDPATIAWLAPELRHPTYAVEGESDVFVSARNLGETVGRSYQDPWSGVDFLVLLPYLEKTLITVAHRDLIVDPYGMIRASKELGLAVDEEPDQPAASERPGLVTIPVEGRDGQLRMPHYETAGHMVTLREPGEFFEDVVEWIGP